MSRGSNSSSSVPDPIKLTLSYVTVQFLIIFRIWVFFFDFQMSPLSQRRCRLMSAMYSDLLMQYVIRFSLFFIVKVERTLPGFTWNFLRGFMERFGLKDSVDIEEMSLRLSALDNESRLNINLIL